MPVEKNLFDYGIEYKINLGNGVTGTLTRTSLQGTSIQEEGPTPDIPKPIQNIVLSFGCDFNGGYLDLSDYHNHKKSIEKEEKNMNKYDELLKLYKDKMEGKINKKYDETTENICKDDLIQKIISEAKQKIKEELTKREEPKELIEDIESELDNVIYLTSATDKILDELRTKQDNELNELYDTLKEVKARLAMTDDYDTQMKILNEYDITNLEGKLKI